MRIRTLRERLLRREQRLKAQSDKIVRAALSDRSRIRSFVRHEYVEFESGARWEWRADRWMVVTTGRPTQ